MNWCEPYTDGGSHLLIAKIASESSSGSRCSKIFLSGTLLVVVLAVAVLAHRRLVMSPPTELGFRDGRLAACPPTPNCVSSYATDVRHRIEPLVLDRDPAAAMTRLREILEKMPRIRIANATDTYLHAEATSLIWGYVDDLEILLVPDERKIHVRSASRTGYSDLGVNRRGRDTTHPHTAGELNDRAGVPEPGPSH